jgi:hypothetical protein
MNAKGKRGKAHLNARGEEPADKRANREDNVKPTQLIPSICPYCDCGCGLYVVVEEGIAKNIEYMEDHPVSQGALRPKGNAALEVVYHPERLRYPVKKKNGSWKRIGWDEATKLISSKLMSNTICSSSISRAFIGFMAFLLWYDLANCFEEFVRGKWFGNKSGRSHLSTIGDRIVSRIAAHDYNRYVWPFLLNLSHQTKTVVPGHLYIYEQEAKILIFHCLQSLLRTGDKIDVKALCLKHLLAAIKDNAFVIHNQYFHTY